jgi:hypothetical protein
MKLTIERKVVFPQTTTAFAFFFCVLQGISRLMFYPDGIDSNRCGTTLAQVLGETKEQNKALKIEVEDLRQKLRDAHGDIKVIYARYNFCMYYSALNDEMIAFKL